MVDPEQDAFRLFSEMVKASLRPEDLDLLAFGRQEVGQLSLPLFLPFSVPNTILQGVFKPKP